jgi:cobalt-zinc-cadmium resistance protein CzcA
MLTRIIDAALRHRLAVLVLAGGVALAGAAALRALPFDAFPDTTAPQVQVNTVAPALGPTEVERLLTIPLEQALAGLPRVAELRSLSKFGLSQVTLQLEDGTDVWFARQQISERLAAVELPEGVERPALGPVATGLGEVFHYVVSSDTLPLAEVRTLHDRLIGPRLRSVPGVAEVNAWGGEEKQWQVVVDPLRLQGQGLALGDVHRALEASAGVVGGGVLARGGAATLVVGLATLDGPEAIGGVVIAAKDGVPVRIRDVARVEAGHEIRRGAVTAFGKGEAVLGLGFMLVGESSREVTRALEARMQELRPTLPAGLSVEVVYARTELVDQVLRTVRNNLLEGALLVVAVLFAFLGSVRAGLVVAAAIPLSMLFAASGMLRFGIAGTLMSLGAIDFGLLVDSSVVLVENAERRLAEDGGRRGVLEVVRDAAVEVRTPTLLGELVIMVVYLPILALGGVEGKTFRPMALTVLLALAGSAIFSMTVAPVLASFVLARRRHREKPRLVRWLERRYDPILRWALGHARLVLGVATVLVLGALAASTRLGSEFVPKLQEGTIVINTVRLAEVSLEESVRFGARIEDRLLEAFPDEILRIWSRTGTAEVATDPMGVELTDVFVTLTPRDRWKRARSQGELAAAMQEELSTFPGMRLAVLQPIEMRVNEMIAGIRSDVGVKIFGDDLDVLKAKAREIDTLLRAIPGAADVTVEQVTGQPLLEIAVDRPALARHGVAARDVLDVVEAVGGKPAGEVREGERRVPLAVKLDPAWASDPARLASILVSTPGGERIPLGRLVTVRETSGPTTIQREGGRRRIVVQANVRGRDLGGFVEEVHRTLEAQVELPAGMYVRYGGQYEHLQRARARLAIVVPLALALVFLLLWLTYRRTLDALRVFVGVPFALVGGVAALFLRGMPFSISAAVGFVALFGVSVLGDMVLVSRVRQLKDEGLAVPDAVREAARTRLRPVLMTAAVAAIGFVPMAMSTGIGAEVQRPLATVVIGGVLSSTLLTLLVLPVLYTLTDRIASRGAGGSGAPPRVAARAEGTHG